MTTTTSKGTILRDTVKAAAKRFRSGWVELAELLTRVRQEEMFKEWGFATFDDYVAQDLLLTKAMANQLVQNYAFLEKHDKKRLEKADGPTEAPAFEVVKVLSKADERGQLEDKDYDAISDRIWDTAESGPALAQELTGRFPAPPPAEPSPGQKLRRLASTGKRFLEEVKHSRQVPAATKERLAAAIEEIEELAENHSEARA